MWDVPGEELRAAVEGCAEELLWRVAVEEPPVDALDVANRLGIVVARNEALSTRAKFVRLPQNTIVVGRNERPERRQWAIAHEIGESVAHQVFQSLGVSAQDLTPPWREQIANELAVCLLLPYRWFSADGRALDWDLLRLKQRYSTASHELIARRMLAMRPPVAVTLCDHGRITWRRCNATLAVPPLSGPERRAWRHSHSTGRSCALGGAVRCWPIHEPRWRREVIRTEFFDDSECT
jgi:hypothetical protein